MSDYEQMLEDFYRSILREGSICVDVGAHGGRHCLPMSQCVGPNGRVFAFEPIEPMAALLHERLIREGVTNVEVATFALGAKEEDADFVLAVDALEYSGLKERIYDSPTRLEHVRVKVKRLDDVIDSSLAVRFIKIDTEGGEWGVLQGSKSILQKWHPFVSFEFGVNSYAQFGVDPLAVHAFLVQLDYEIMDINRVSLGPEEFAESSRRQQVWDYLAIPKDARLDPF